MNNVMENEQTDYLCRMNRPVGIATNLALRENVFSCFVCLMNRLPIIIVGMPGCSKSLSVKLLLSNLRGTSSEEDYFKGLPGV
jgi:MoxR-like ATPase